MSPKEIRDILTRPGEGGYHSGIVMGLARTALEAKSQMFNRLLPALLWYTDKEQLKTAQTPKMGGEGTDISAEIAAAYLHWEAIDLFGFYYPYDKAREAVYSTYDPDNIEKARMFWVIASRMSDIKSVPKGDYDIVPWKENLLSPAEIEAPIKNFRDSSIDRKGQWVGKMPLQNKIEYGATPDKATIFTSFTFASITRQFSPFGTLSRQMEKNNIQAQLVSDGDELQIHIVGAKTDKEARMPRACVMALFDLITMRQYTKAKITDDGVGDIPLAIKSLLVSALVLHDMEAPKWDGENLERSERIAIRPQIYMGLARGRLSGNTLKALPPAPDKFSRQVSADEAAALYRYMQWGNIRADEKVPKWVRLPGVVVEQDH